MSPHILAEPRPSLVARLDPRTRVVAAVLFAVVTISAQGLASPAAALLAASGMAALARLPLPATVRRVAAMDGFMVLALALLPFTTPGEAVGQVLGWPLSAEGLRKAASILLKANAVVLAVLALVGSMETVQLGRALGRLGAPERLTQLFLFTVRYVEVLHAEYRRLRLAMRARGFRMTSSAHTWRSMGHLVGMMLVSSLERSERIHAAMRLRGFSGRFHSLEESRAGAVDWGFAAACAVLAVAQLVLEMA